MNYLSWHVGMKVVCTKRIRADVWSGEILPLVGAVYTVREITVAVIDGQERVGVRLKEIVNEPRQYCDAFAEAIWAARAFRPLVTRKTSISIFTAMLHGIDQKVDA